MSQCHVRVRVGNSFWISASSFTWPLMFVVVCSALHVSLECRWKCPPFDFAWPTVSVGNKMHLQVKPIGPCHAQIKARLVFMKTAKVPHRCCEGGGCVFFWIAHTRQVAKLCDVSVGHEKLISRRSLIHPSQGNSLPSFVWGGVSDSFSRNSEGVLSPVWFPSLPNLWGV